VGNIFCPLSNLKRSEIKREKELESPGTNIAADDVRSQTTAGLKRVRVILTFQTLRTTRQHRAMSSSARAQRAAAAQDAAKAQLTARMTAMKRLSAQERQRRDGQPQLLQPSMHRIQQFRHDRELPLNLLLLITAWVWACCNCNTRLIAYKMNSSTMSLI
jgi:hypothetical protein